MPKFPSISVKISSRDGGFEVEAARGILEQLDQCLATQALMAVPAGVRRLGCVHPVVPPQVALLVLPVDPWLAPVLRTS